MKLQDLKLLQEPLRLLGFATEDSEGYFGETTRRAAHAFQETHGLETNGIVDEHTVGLLNGKVTAMSSRSQKGPLVQGCLVDVDGYPVEGVTIKAFDRQRCGPTRVPGRGNHDESRIVRGLLHAGGTAQVEGDGKRMLSFVESLTNQFARCSRRQRERTMPKMTEPQYTVSGRVVSHELRGLVGMRVVAVDRNVERDTPLGEGTSGERGAYDINYLWQRQRKEKPDVQVQVTGERCTHRHRHS